MDGWTGQCEISIPHKLCGEEGVYNQNGVFIWSADMGFIFIKLENVLMKHYAPNHMLAPKRTYIT